jgi:hypothetical protein
MRKKPRNQLGDFAPIDTCVCRKGQGTFGAYVDRLYAHVDLGKDDTREVLMVLCTLLGRAQGAVLVGDRKALREALAQLSAIVWRLGESLEST